MHQIPTGPELKKQSCSVKNNGESISLIFYWARWILDLEHPLVVVTDQKCKMQPNVVTIINLEMDSCLIRKYSNLTVRTYVDIGLHECTHSH